MHQRICKALTLVLFLFSPLASYAQSHHHGTAEPSAATCASAGQTAAIAYAIREFEDRVPNGVVRTVAWNDLMCTDPEWMMNVVLTVTDNRSAKAWYGVFHIHFLPNGMFKSAASINGVTWTPMHSDTDWGESWCEFLRTVYPEDFRSTCVLLRYPTPEKH